MGQGTHDYILVKFQITLLGVSANMWGAAWWRSGLSECFSSSFSVSVSLEGISEKPLFCFECGIRCTMKNMQAFSFKSSVVLLRSELSGYC